MDPSASGGGGEKRSPLEGCFEGVSSSCAILKVIEPSLPGSGGIKMVEELPLICGVLDGVEGSRLPCGILRAVGESSGGGLGRLESDMDSLPLVRLIFEGKNWSSLILGGSADL